MSKANLYKISGVFLLLICMALTPPSKPVFYLVGDSTVRNPTPPCSSWGQVIHHYFDTTRLSISNQAMAGRSTRQYINEGRWKKVLDALKPGDFVLVQFGHNEGGRPDTSRMGRRPVLKGNGDDSVVVNYKNGAETVHSYGWYLRKFAGEAKAKGATVMIASMIASNFYRDGKIARADKSYGLWAKEAAQQSGSFFLDANNIIADKFEKMGPELVNGLFPYDPVHTNIEGAGVNAGAIVKAIKSDSTNTLNSYFAGKKF